MRVVAQFERVGLGKSADERKKFWSPFQKFLCELGIRGIYNSFQYNLLT